MGRAITNVLGWILVLAFVGLVIAGCASKAREPLAPMKITFSDGSWGTCNLENRHGDWDVVVPGSVDVRTSSDVLSFNCVTISGQSASGYIPLESNAARAAVSSGDLQLAPSEGIAGAHARYPRKWVVTMPAD